eukprot:39170-Chlamydomonas_euryale.AAC.11
MEPHRLWCGKQDGARNSPRTHPSAGAGRVRGLGGRGIIVCVCAHQYCGMAGVYCGMYYGMYCGMYCGMAGEPDNFNNNYNNADNELIRKLMLTASCYVWKRATPLRC